jgi:hypothetical protein
MEGWVSLSRKVGTKKQVREWLQFQDAYTLHKLCCRLRDLGVLLVWVMYLQRSSWPIKYCGTFASRKLLRKKQVREWLQFQDAYTLHKPTRRRFPRRRVVVYRIDHQWQADLVDLAKLSSFNKAMRPSWIERLRRLGFFCVWSTSTSWFSMFC